MPGGQGQVISWYICTIVPVLFLAARLFARLQNFGRLFVDDGFLILSACCLIGDLVIQQHMWNLGMATPSLASRENFIGIMEMIVPGAILYVTSLWAIKVALVLFYKKLGAPGTRLHLIYNITLAFLAVSWAVLLFDIIFQCWPWSRRWARDPASLSAPADVFTSASRPGHGANDEEEQCSKKAADFNYWITILLNIFSDVLIIVLPITMVLKLQMPLKQKIGVVAMFALGFFVLIASIIRAYYSKRNRLMLTCTFSMFEVAVAIIATCLPALRTLFTGHSSRVGTDSASYGRHYELSSRNKSKTASRNKPSNGSTFVGAMSKDAGDSEDESVRNGPPEQIAAIDPYGEEMVWRNRRDGINDLTEFEVYDEESGGKRTDRQ